MYTIQLINTAGANANGGVIYEDRHQFVMGLGARLSSTAKKDFSAGANCHRQRGAADWFRKRVNSRKTILRTSPAKGSNVDMVFEHPGEATFPVSTLICKEAAWS
jgi:crotonyl-CoA carboxylase/reductase